MKKVNLLSVAILSLVLAGCKGNSHKTEDCIMVDVTATYPEKELILQDVMDVEYIPLETTDEFITQGSVKAFGNNILLVKNHQNDGTIFVFDRATGKGLRKINHLGQSGEEYSEITGIVLDEANNEMFVIDYPARKILVYNLEGSYKRSFPFSDNSFYSYPANYDNDNLICYKGYAPDLENEQSCHVLISKKDGTITKEIRIPIDKISTPVWIKDDIIISPSYTLSVCTPDQWLLVRASSDTIYNYLPDGTTSPAIVRTPSIHSMDPQIFLYPTVVTNRYYFMQTLTKKFNLERMNGFPTKNLMYDKQEKALFKYTVYNDDFIDKRQVNLEMEVVNPINQGVAAFHSLEAAKLMEANAKGKLKGKLKDIAEKLEEDSNPVIMLIKHKKSN